MDDYPYLNKVLGQVLKSRREELGLSKRKLAEMARLERVYLIQLERGEKKPTLNALFYLSKALGWRPYELVLIVEEELKKIEQGTFSSDENST